MSVPDFYTMIMQDDIKVFPLSLAQKGLWISDDLQANSHLNTLSAATLIKRPLSIRTLQSSFDALVQRHAALRTIFQVIDGQPQQVILPALHIPLSMVELRARSATLRQAEVQRLAAEEALQPFDLTHGPLVRASLLWLGAEEYMLLVSAHRMVCDRWSLGVCLRELAGLYEALVNDQPSPLPEGALSYVDFVLQQQAWLQGKSAAEQLSYWKQQLADSPESLDLLATRQPFQASSSTRATYNLTLPAMLSEALQTLSQREGVRLDTTLVAALQALLYRYSGQEDIQTGITVTGRTQGESEMVPGLFENALVLRSGLTDDLSFRALLAQVHETLQHMQAHQELPFEYLIGELNPAHPLEYNSFFRVMFSLLPPPPALPAGWTVTRMDGGMGSARCDLNLIVEKREGRLLVHFAYRSDLFDEATIARMAGHWQTLLEGVIADPEMALALFPLLTGSERHRLLVEWNAPQIAYSQDRCVHELFEAQVERTPEAVAVVCNGQQLLYSELNQRANQLAHHLRELGVRPEVPVGICVDRSLDMVIGLLAIFKAGGVHVPLDAASPASRIAFIMADTGMRVLLTQQHLLARFPEPHPPLVCLDADQAIISQQPTTNPAPLVRGEHLAYIIYTSGSTGQPKGVLIEHHAIATHCGAMIQAQELSADDSALQFNSFTFDASLEQMLPPLLVGAKLLLRGPEVWSPADLLRQVKAHQLTVLSLSCDYWYEVIAAWAATPEQLDGLRLRLVVAGGDRFPPEAVQLWQQSPLSCKLFNIYGPTEATIGTTIFDIPRQVAQEQPAASIPIGRPLPDHTVYILDKAGQPVPEGVAGELHIGGQQIARGYLNRPELTAERFVTDPFGQQPQARLYKTGDLARYLPGGIIEFLGRVDHQVKIRGYRIELGEIEAAIKLHPAAYQALVIVREDTPGVKRVVAYVVSQPAQEAAQLVAQLRELLKERLPDYMVPAAFVLLSAFPLNINGKIDRHALPLPDYQEIERQEPFVEPRTALEEIVTGILAEVLGIEHISVHDDFFALGGHSLLAMQVISRMQTFLHVNVPLRRFFEAPTAAGLAEVVASLQEAPASFDQPVLRRLEREAYRLPAAGAGSAPASSGYEYPASLTQEGLWFLHQLEPESTAYNVYSILRTGKSLDIEMLEYSLNVLVQRHEALRTTFGTRNGKPVQLIVPAVKLMLPILELQHTPDDERRAEARRLASIEARRPFDLAKGPLLRALLLRLTPEESLLLLTVHHIVVDGWSLNVLLSELSSLYETFMSKQPSPLPDLALQYPDFSVWQRELLQGERLAEQLGYWEQLLANGPEVMDLPFARPRPAQPSTRGTTYLLTLPRTLSDELSRLSRKLGVTPYMTLVAAFQTLLYRYTGQEDLVIGTVAANRTLVETEALVGFFVNTLALRTDLSGDPDFTALLARVREVVLAAQSHQELPFATLVKAIQPGRRQAGRNPLFQVMMSFDTPAASLSEGWEPVDLGNLTATAQFDLSLEVQENSQGWRCRFEYSTDLFDEATIVRLAAHWQTLLAGIVADPRQPLSLLPIVPEGERQQQLVEWNATGEERYPLEQGLAQLFETQVARTPRAMVVVCEDEQWSYQELNAAANRLARQLRERGIGPEKLVALLSERGIPFLISMLAVFKAGGAYLPLDPHHPAARLRQIIEHSRCSAVLTTAEFAPTLADLLEEVSSELRPAVFSFAEMMQADQREENLAACGTPRDLAYVIYTSGSTGKPKGAMIEQRGMINHLHAKIDALSLTARDKVAQTASQSFDISVWQYLAPLLVGGCVQIYPDEVAHDPVQLLTQVERHRVSILETVPSLLRAMLDADEIEGTGRPALTALRWLIPTGEALPAELCRRWLSIYPHVPLLNAYGPTECSDDVTHYPIYVAPASTGSPIPIGRAIPNMRLYVLDRRLQPLPIGVSGELYVGGIGVGRGYLGNTRHTAETFVPDPFVPQDGARLYKTGDLARFLPDGNIEFLGRLDFQVKLRGFRIELGEIEAVLNQHPDVQQAVVMAREDTPGEKRLVAYVQISKEQNTTAAELKSHVMGRVPAYMVPSAFLLLEKLPLTANGKVDRRALPVPESGRSVIEENYVAPRLPVERQLVRIWEELLAVQPIGIKDDFFEVGGDSLLAVRLFDQIAQVSGKKLPLSALFAGATVEHLAQVLMEKPVVAPLPEQTGRAPLVAVQQDGSLPPFFYLHGEWKGGGLYSRELARHLGSEQPFYLLEPYTFDGLDVLPTFEEVAAAHLDAMRTIQPEGPYFLSGYCNGALLAYEMARQLLAQGQEVGLLLLMDPDFPARHGEVRLAISHLCDLLHIGPEKQFEAFIALQHVYRYLRFAHYRRSTDAELLKNGKKGKMRLASLSLKLKAVVPRVKILGTDWSNIYDWLVANYTPGLYPGRITFFWTSEEPQRSDGWQKVMKAKEGEIEVYMNPGNHISGRTEYLPVLAERLRICLRKAQALRAHPVLLVSKERNE